MKIYAELSCISAFDIELKLLQKDDLELLLFWRNTPEILPFMENDRPVTLQMLQYWHARAISGKSTYPYIAIYNQKKIGYTEIKDIDFQSRTCTDGIFLFGENNMGMGVGKRIFLCREIVIKTLQLETIYSYIKHDNSRSQNFYKSFGSKLIDATGDLLLYKNDMNERRHCLRNFARQLNLENEYMQLI